MSGGEAGPRRAAWLWTWLPLLVWMGLIYLFSDQPDIPSVASSWLDLLLKKGLHALAYAILATLWWRALVATGLRRRALVWAFLLSLAYAASDEWHQTFVPGRSGQVTDVLIDGLGALAAVGWLGWWSRRSSPVSGRT